MRTFDLTEAAAFLLISPGRLRAKAKAGAVPGRKVRAMARKQAAQPPLTF